MEILQWIYDAIDEVNEDLDQSGQILKSVDAQIFGNESALDSMGLVNLITLIEQRIEDETGKFISIADEKAMSMESSPFKTVSSLKEYITNVLNE
jgi:acyl carrier protein